MMALLVLAVMAALVCAVGWWRTARKLDEAWAWADTFREQSNGWRRRALRWSDLRETSLRAAEASSADEVTP